MLANLGCTAAALASSTRDAETTPSLWHVCIHKHAFCFLHHMLDFSDVHRTVALLTAFFPFFFFLRFLKVKGLQKMSLPYSQVKCALWRQRLNHWLN